MAASRWPGCSSACCCAGCAMGAAARAFSAGTSSFAWLGVAFPSSPTLVVCPLNLPAPGPVLCNRPHPTHHWRPTTPESRHELRCVAVGLVFCLQSCRQFSQGMIRSARLALSLRHAKVRDPGGVGLFLKQTLCVCTFAIPLHARLALHASHFSASALGCVVLSALLYPAFLGTSPTRMAPDSPLHSACNPALSDLLLACVL